MQLTGLGGIGVLVAVAAIGALVDGLARGGPGLILDVSVVVGAVLAGMLISSRRVWLVIPMPPLVFAVMAVAAGVIADHGAAGSASRLAGAAAAWVAKGFVAMVAATLLVIVIVIVRSVNRRL
ncbi:DUF6542 domain-containing protein [Actinoallomurus sp. NPDC050550]|uniref:DUF6542 domain-containing protein n=1 Tax=Actinoallomurus sp. NPDC050550 TaxID=3154937 RepID=UPI0033C03187